MVFTTTAPVSQLYFPKGKDALELVITNTATGEAIDRLQVMTILPQGCEGTMIIHVTPEAHNDQFSITTIENRQFLIATPS
jgi:hypothetical protein